MSGRRANEDGERPRPRDRFGALIELGLDAYDEAFNRCMMDVEAQRQRTLYPPGVEPHLTFEDAIFGRVGTRKKQDDTLEPMTLEQWRAR